MSHRHNGRTPPSHTRTHQSQDSATTESMLEKMTKAKDLESHLESIQKSKQPDAKSSAIRLELCSLFSDVVILDPLFAASHNTVERLWKHCFYGRINELRQRLSKEKNRAKKQGAASTASDHAAEIEKQLQQFLKEAIALYQYLIKKYVEILSSESQEDDTEYVESTISSLYRMHIHLGDLYRYSSSFPKAEECYVKSSKLAPSTGNPYNQLAVVAQSQDNSVVALYYYARSLMAVVPFETSRPNLVRLFESNRKWLAEHSRGESTRSLVQPEGGKKAQKDWRQKQKSAVTRMTLAKFVDLQHDFFRGISLDDGDGKVDWKELVDKMTAQLASLDELLSNSGCSEALLCKIVAILAFSTLGASNQGKLFSADQLTLGDMSRSNQGVIMNNQAIVFSFMLRFLSLLGKHTIAIINERESIDKDKVGTIRPLSALLIGVNFAYMLYEGSEWFHGLPLFPPHSCDRRDHCPIRNLCHDSHLEFWDSIAGVFNCIQEKGRRTRGGVPTSVNDLREFNEFRCYVPYSPFLQWRDDPPPKYTYPDAALRALSPNNNLTKAEDDETDVRINLFEVEANRAPVLFTKDGLPCFLERDPARPDYLKVVREKDFKSRSTIQDMLCEHVDNHTKDVGEAETKSQYSQLGVPLLTPAALLGDVAPPFSPSHVFDEHNVVDSFAPDLTIMQPKSKQKPLHPPPGFNGPPANTDSLLSLLPQPRLNLVQPSAYGSNLGERSSLDNVYQTPFNAGVMSQAGPSIYDTLNPFAALKSPTAQSPSIGIDLNLMLNSSLQKNYQGTQASPSTETDPYSHHESLLKFLFESNSSDD